MNNSFARLVHLLAITGLLLGCQSTDKTNAADSTSSKKLMPLNFSVAASFPHDTSSYTQGLQVYKGRLFEGTGQYGSSTLREIDLKTGKAKRFIALDAQYFGEGVTVLRDTIYQLTWREKKVFRYNLAFKKIGEFSIDKEGWGLTHNGKELILSNGSGELFFYNPTTMTLLRSQLVTEEGSPSYNLNELEFVDGYVYANQYTTPYILKIDPTTGEVVGKADCSALLAQAQSLYPGAEVLNGIAYDSTSKNFLITGKWWPQLYQVSFGH
jgi:glutamine cyclotransferase